MLVTLVVASALAGRLRLSAIPIFIVAGILLGPSPGFPEVVSPSEGTELLARLGIVLLLFFLGLEFSLDRLTAARRMVVVGGAIDLVVNAGLGLLVGVLLLGPSPEAVLLAGLIYISSSGIVTRALFDLRRLADDETDLVLGVLVFEDLAIALFLGIAAALATGEAVGGLEIAGTAGLALGFVIACLLLGRWAHHVFDRIGPRLDREQLLLGALAVAIGGGALGEAAGLSEAVGALLAGILLSGSEVRDQIEQQLLGLRDFAAAIFFFAFGLEVDLSEADDAGLWLAAAVPVAVIGKLVAGFVAGRANGFSPRQSVNVGAALVARGEFTIILAGLAAGGAALDAEFRGLVAPFAGLFVLVTAVAGVVLMRESRRIGRLAFPPRAVRRESRR
ncbi:cation:proton antiporter [Miltoncostaea marina]|uniref:cation:proton antiporter n=1 Tax=Miltoncostaea marina TaxID=2843215 RepID=UPI001C3D4241|nr:cation:proton antiporter [Miltoncostaea marina]